MILIWGESLQAGHNQLSTDPAGSLCWLHRLFRAPESREDEEGSRGQLKPGPQKTSAAPPLRTCMGQWWGGPLFGSRVFADTKDLR